MAAATCLSSKEENDNSPFFARLLGWGMCSCSPHATGRRYSHSWSTHFQLNCLNEVIFCDPAVVALKLGANLKSKEWKIIFRLLLCLNETLHITANLALIRYRSGFSWPSRVRARYRASFESYSDTIRVCMLIAFLWPSRCSQQFLTLILSE